MKEGLHVRAHYSPYADHVELLIGQADAHGHRDVVRELTFERVEPGSYLGPTTHIDLTAAQMLMDDLWNAGIRPTEGSGSAGSLKATERHLNDMRKIAGAKLNVAL
ncbi:MAG: hypothetical protein ACSHXK_15420 [Oceanococcus sp.]